MLLHVVLRAVRQRQKNALRKSRLLLSHAVWKLNPFEVWSQSAFYYIMVCVQKWFCTPGFADLIKNILLKYLHKRQMITFFNLYFIWHLRKVFKPNFSFSGSLCFITWAGVVLQKLSVATATAVDPSLRGQQTQVLTSSVINAAQRELTFEEMRKFREG